ncbi:MAG: DNA glycosylase AlkZ-like family protein [Candidatus Methylomirabilales bacterium]
MNTEAQKALESFHPAVQAWFARRFQEPTAPQVQGWPAIGEGSHTIISAPTGSGKTLAAFLWCIDHLVQLGISGGLTDEVHILYISPLKALTNDIQQNLIEPLNGIREVAQQMGVELPELRSAVRTGDTLAAERTSMRKRPPHILITTPESLFILLTSEGFRPALETVRFVIVDEIHAVAENKRGVHLSLSLERLTHLTRKEPVRIGLSATVHPIDEMAHFLVGCEWWNGTLTPRPCRVVDVGGRREMDLEVIAPLPELGAVATNAVWDATYARLADLIQTHRSTLVFCNSRRLAERIAVRLSERLEEGQIASHHGSLSRRQRLKAESRLKAGEIKAVVATGSLELGIDVGSIDLVCQVESPRSIAGAVQRIGRSGHYLSATPKGRLFALTQDDLIECAAIIRAIHEGKLDRIQIPRNSLDVLGQQLVAAASSDEWQGEDLYRLCRQSFCFIELSRDDFDGIVQMLSERLPTEPRGVYPKLYWDRLRDRVKARRGGRLAAVTSGGTIPDTTNYDVFRDPEGLKIGEVEEDFAQESMVGDIFALGNASWRIKKIERGRMIVEDAQGLPPSIPFWHGEVPGRTYDLSLEVSRLRSDLADRLADPTQARSWLSEVAKLGEAAAECAVAYVARQQAAVGLVPTHEVLLAERFFDNLGGTQIVLHAPFGMRVNRAWGLALSKRMCRRFNFEIQSASTDDGILLSFGPRHSFPLETLFHFLSPETVEEVLIQALLTSPIFEARFRQAAVRALLILRHAQGRRVPAYLQRLRATDLLAACFPEQQACFENREPDIDLPSYPLVQETVRESLWDALDLDRLTSVLRGLQTGTIRTASKEISVPSPFAHKILAAWDYAFIDDAPREERRSRTVQTHRGILGQVVPEDSLDGFLDREAVEQVTAEVARIGSRQKLRDADELVEFLKEGGSLSQEEIGRRVDEEPKPILENLRREGRVVQAVLDGKGIPVWVAAETIPLCRAAYPDLRLVDTVSLPEAVAADTWEPEAACRELVRRHLRHVGPTTAEAVSSNLCLSLSEVQQTLAGLEAEGLLFRGNFVPGLSTPQWCERTVLERIHRLTLARLRKQIEPVPKEKWIEFLLRWQHLSPHARLHGVDGLHLVIEKLQGLEMPAGLWEAEILGRRVADYRPELLDQLCLSGEIVWGRTDTSPQEARHGLDPGPLALFHRDAVPRLRRDISAEGTARVVEGLSPDARKLYEVLDRKGPSFTSPLVSASGMSPEKTHAALWELVRSGLATNDSFTPLRFALSREGHQVKEEDRPSRRTLRRRVGLKMLQGRWSLLPSGEAEAYVESWTRQLLGRFGVLFRELLTLETGAPVWREIHGVLRRMEYAGQVRRGLFVTGVSGEQYALPEAVDLLRAMRKDESSGTWTVVSALDPCAIWGAVLDGPKIARLPGNLVILRAGLPILALEGRRIHLFTELNDEELSQAIITLVQEREGRKLVVERWNNEPVATSRGALLLGEAGFHTDGERLVYDGLHGPKTITARLSGSTERLD